jgi:hypothetical protein
MSTVLQVGQHVLPFVLALCTDREHSSSSTSPHISQMQLFHTTAHSKCRTYLDLSQILGLVMMLSTEYTKCQAPVASKRKQMMVLFAVLFYLSTETVFVTHEW